MDTVIRPAEARDLGAILEIVNNEILHGVAHFGTEPQTMEDAAKDFEGAATHPWFVAEVGGEIAGFAKCGRWKARRAYDWAVEVSVYLRPAYHRRGLGRALYETLFDELERRGFRRVIAGMTMPNDASEGLHRAMGMRLVGTFERNGFKNGKWRDVRYYQMDLPRGGDPPHDPEAPPAPIF